MAATRRFSDRVRDYARYRPSYPAAAIDLSLETGLDGEAVVADVGAGTGLFTELLLPRAATVHAVEPDEAMRAEADRRLGTRPGYIGVTGTSEHTTLADRSVDLITAAQAFHWFEPSAARTEFDRILCPRGRVALIWNRRDHTASEFLRRYEKLLETSLPEYDEVTHERTSSDAIDAFLGPGVRRATFPHRQRFDLEGLRGRLLSSSYAPQPGHPGHDGLMTALGALFDESGEVTFAYRAELYLSSP